VCTPAFKLTLCLACSENGLAHNFLSPFEAERYIEELQAFTLEDIGGSAWMKQHEQLEKLNLQAHSSAKAHADEFVLEACLTFDKLEVLVRDLLLIEVWKEQVLPKVLEALDKENTMKAYFVLYHEATVCNILECFLFHEHACEAIGESLIEVIDFCMRKLLYLTSMGKAEVVEKHATATETCEALEHQTSRQELERHHRNINFSVGLSAVSMLRFLCEHAPKMPVSVLTRIMDTHDVIVQTVPLIEYPPWTFRTDDGKWKKFTDNKWQVVEAQDLLKLTKLEGQVWLMLYWLTCDPDCRARYTFNSFRKEQLLRVRKYLNDVMLDQLPVLANVQRYMDELSIMECPPATAQASGLLMEAVPVLRNAFLDACDADALCARAMETILKVDKDDGDLKSLADMYAMDGVEGMYDGDGPVAEQEAVLVVLSLTVEGVDGQPVDQCDFNYSPHPDLAVEETSTSESPQGTFTRVKLHRQGSEDRTWESGPTIAVPADSRLLAKLVFSNGQVVELASTFLALPAALHACKSPAEMAKKKPIPVPADEPSLPPAQWRQLGSLESSDQIVQVQLLRLESTHSHSKCAGADAAPTDVMLDAYGIGAIYANYKSQSPASAAEEELKNIFAKNGR
jgi:hypothetical protein